MSPSYGFCLLQIPCWCEFSFSLVSLGGFPRKWASPSGSHYGKTKYGDKIAPCGRKKMAGTLPLSQMDLSVFIRVICGRLPLSACFFTTAGSYFELYFVFLMSSSRLVGLFSESPKGSQGNKRTWLPGMAASQTYKGRHKEVFLSFN